MPETFRGKPTGEKPVESKVSPEERLANEALERDQYELACRCIEISEEILDDFSDMRHELRSRGLLKSHGGWWDKMDHSLTLFSRLCEIFRLSEDAKSYAFSVLNEGRKIAEAISRDESESEEKDPVVSVKEFLKRQENEGNGEKTILANLHMLASELNQTLNQAISFIPEKERTPEMYQKALDLPIKVFEQTRKLIGQYIPGDTE